MRGSALSPDVARSQDGVFTIAQAIAAGYSRKQVLHRLREGRWVVLLGSVYADTGTRLTTASLARAASLAAGTGALVSHLTAAQLWGLRVPADPEVHVVVSRERRLRISGLRAHRLEVTDAEVAVLDGIPCTDLLRTTLDCLLWLPEEAGRAMAVDSLQRGRFEVDALRHALTRTGQRHGLARAWSVLRDVAAGAHSEAEVRIHRLLRASGILGWQANVAVSDPAGLIGIVDVLFDVPRLVLEVDGRAYHSDDAAFQRDRARQNRLVLAGFQVLRFTWDDLSQRPELVVATVERILRESTTIATHGVVDRFGP